MKRSKLTLAFLFALAIAAFSPSADLFAQKSSRLTRPCSGSSTPAKVEIESDGDISFSPCSGRTVNFPSVLTAGSVPFAGTSGALTQNNSAFYWDTTNVRLKLRDSSYSSADSGFSDATATSSLVIGNQSSVTENTKYVYGALIDTKTTQAGGTALSAGMRIRNTTARTVGSGTSYGLMVGSNNTGSTVTTNVYGIDVDARASENTTTNYGIQSLVGFNSGGSGTAITTAAAFRGSCVNGAGSTTITECISFYAHINGNSPVTNAYGLRFSTWSGSQIANTYGIYADTGIDKGTSSRYFIYSLSTSPSFFSGKITYDATNTAGGTTGDQTINKPSGTVNVAAGAGTAGLTVTNSFVAATSIVYAVARTNDATCAVKNVVPAAGSFVLRMTANCTAETSVGFIVAN